MAAGVAVWGFGHFRAARLQIAEHPRIRGVVQKPQRARIAADITCWYFDFPMGLEV